MKFRTGLLCMAIISIGCTHTGRAKSDSAAGVLKCPFPNLGDIDRWQEQDSRREFSFKLPPEFQRDPGREKQFVHGGEVWSDGTRTVQMVQGWWRYDSFEIPEQCTAQLDGMPTMLMWQENRDGVEFAALIQDPPSVFDTVLGAHSANPRDLKLFLRIMETVQRTPPAQ